MDKKVVELDLKIVLPNRFQPRIKFNEDSIVELAESIKEHGVISPIIVRPINDKYEIIAGERRYKASVMAGKTTIPAIITDLDDKDSIEVALIENVQRQDLTPIEEAVSYKKILDMGYLKQEDLANKLGKSQSTIANKLRLLNLDDSVQEALLDQKISERHARSLLRLSTFEQQKEALKNVMTNRLTVRKTDELIANMLNPKEELEIINIDERIEGKEMNNENINNLNIPSAPIVNDVVVEEPIIEPMTFSPINPTIETVTPMPQPVQSVNTVEPLPVIPTPIQEVVNSVPAEPIAAPGFMDVDKIQSEAQDIYVPKPVADMNSLLGGTEPVQQPVVEAPAVEEIPQGKFFNILAEDNNIIEPQTQTVNPFASAPVVENAPTYGVDQNPGIVNQPIVTPTYEVPTPVVEAPVMQPAPQILEPTAQIFEPAAVTTPAYEPTTIVDNPVVTNDPVIAQPTPIFEQPISQPIVPEPVQPVVTPVEATYAFEQPAIVPEINNSVQQTPMPVYESVLDSINLNNAPIVSPEPTSISESVITSAPAPITNIMPAISKVREVASILESMGYKVEVEEMDLPQNYQVNIIIEKD